jgi:hypothetical protein
MKKILVSILLMLALLAWVTPVAADKKVTVGTRINLHTKSPITFPAGAPFYISHGFGFNVGKNSIEPQNMRGIYDFKLEIDGVYQKPDFVQHTLDKNTDPATLWELPVFNFPNGMTGVHTFTGHWISPCGKDCPNPTTPVEVQIKSLTVEFISP